MPNRRRICKAGAPANMKAIILSAGQGSRLGHLVDDRPKCLIDFNGRTLLDRQLDTLEANGVHEAVVVTGFHDELVETAIAARSGGPAVRTIFNPFYKVADNTGSLYMAREELERRLPGVERRYARLARADEQGGRQRPRPGFASPSTARTGL